MTQGSVSGWKKVLPWLKWPLALGIIGFLVYKNRDRFLELWQRPIHWEYLAIGCALCLCSVMLTFLRWYLLVWAQEFKFTPRDALRIGFLGYLFNYIASGSIGGDVVKGAMLVRRQKDRRLAAVSTVVIDRMLGLVSLMFVGALATVIAEGEVRDRAIINNVFWIGATIGIGIVGLMLHPVSSNSRLVHLITRIPKIGSAFADLAQAAAMYQSRRRIVIAGIMIGIMGQFGVISSFYFCARAVGDPSVLPAYKTHLLLMPLAELIGFVVPTPGGIGALEFCVQKAYDLAGSSPELGLVAAGAYRLTSICVAMIGGVYYFTGRDEIKKVLDEDNAEQS